MHVYIYIYILGVFRFQVFSLDNLRFYLTGKNPYSESHLNMTGYFFEVFGSDKKHFICRILFKNPMHISCQACQACNATLAPTHHS